MGRKVTVIPPTISLQTHLPTTQKVKRKVAGYARVSTDFEEQLTSYEAQVDYYTKYIQEREDWEFVKVYTDEGISATSTVHSDGFNQMVADALEPVCTKRRRFLDYGAKTERKRRGGVF